MKYAIKMQAKRIFIYFLLIFALVACANEVAQPVEVTRLVPQTVEVTRIIVQPTDIQMADTLEITPSPSVISSSVTVEVNSSSVQMEPEHFDGIVILTQYYTLLNHHLYEESYKLLSSAQQEQYPLEEYEGYYTGSIEAIEIRSIQPYEYWFTLREFLILPTPANELRYVVSLTSFHKGPAWNKDGDQLINFQTLVLEQGEWKVDKASTSSWLPPQ